MITHKVETDTIFNLKEVYYFDTVKIIKDNLKVEFIKLPNDTIKINAQCDSDTIRVPYEVKVPFEKVVIKKQNNIKQIFIILGLLTLIVIFARRLG